MKVNAIVECVWCGHIETIPPKKTTRLFNIAFNKLKKEHDWGCESRGKAKLNIDHATSTVNDIINKLKSASNEPK